MLAAGASGLPHFSGGLGSPLAALHLVTLGVLTMTAMGASLVAALGLVIEAPFDRIATLFGVLAIVGWLLTFLLAMLQRIVPFLASMHAAAGRHRPPTPSSLTAQRPLAIHFACHTAALALLVLAVVFGIGWLPLAGAVVGGVGAVAFGAFFAAVLHRMSSGARAANRNVRAG